MWQYRSPATVFFSLSILLSGALPGLAIKADSAHVYLDTYLSPFLNRGSPAYGSMNLLWVEPSKYRGAASFVLYPDSSVNLRGTFSSYHVLQILGTSTSISPGSLLASPTGQWVTVLETLSGVQPDPLPVGEYDVGRVTIYDSTRPPGSDESFPLLPTATGTGGWHFGFSVGSTSTPVFVDPLVAIGYDYFVDAGPNFASVLLPSVGDNQYDLWLWNNTLSSWTDTGIDLTGGSRYDFAAGGVDRFRILGIETAAGLDPADATAFVTGLWFTGTGSVTMRQVPVTFDTTIPAPGALALVFIGVAGLRVVRRKLT